MELNVDSNAEELNANSNADVNVDSNYTDDVDSNYTDDTDSSTDVESLMGEIDTTEINGTHTMELVVNIQYPSQIVKYAIDDFSVPEALCILRLKSFIDPKTNELRLHVYVITKYTSTVCFDLLLLEKLPDDTNLKPLSLKAYPFTIPKGSSSYGYNHLMSSEEVNARRAAGHTYIHLNICIRNVKTDTTVSELVLALAHKADLDDSDYDWGMPNARYRTKMDAVEQKTADLHKQVKTLQEQLKVLQTERGQSEKVGLCPICQAKIVTRLYVECSHCLCDDCWTDGTAKQCPVCRQSNPTKQFRRIHI